ncbi:MAG: 23S rRNA (guanosine(2251)-2'-O)-methyltransferase RlmB [Actinomycetia bacterium]|nr:23S rRNA (guanosine(2251)-2'-O)-methyltransferase RlmB [Actinomycetes bacterium]
MAGNSQRKGATRKSGSKKGAQVGSGGNRKQALAGKGPTPAAKDRKGHPAARGRSRGKSGKPTRTSPEVILGRNAVSDALAAGIPGTELVILETVDDDPRVTRARRAAEKAGIPLSVRSRPELDRLGDGLPHQGIALVVPNYEYAELSTVISPEVPPTNELGVGANQPIVVVLDHLQDAGNLGAIARSSAAFAANGVVIANRRAASISASAWRASAGAFARIPIASVTNIARSVTTLKKAGFLAIGLSTDGGTPINNIHGDFLNRPIALIVGSESDGISRLVAEKCDVFTTIAIASSTESLNASVATGIALNVIRSA